MKKEYIGDGVYVEFDGFGIELTAQRETATDRVYLEPALMAKLIDYHLRASAGPEEYADDRDMSGHYEP